jgi:Family of unknown function (DUF5985)
MIEFIFGASVFGCCVIALAFLSAWRRTGDRLFALFSLAFWAFAANRVAITAVDDTGEAEPYVYLVRLLAFGLIIAAIIDKNRAAVPRRDPRGRRTQRV